MAEQVANHWTIINSSTSVVHPPFQGALPETSSLNDLEPFQSSLKHLPKIPCQFKLELCKAGYLPAHPRKNQLYLQQFFSDFETLSSSIH